MNVMPGETQDARPPHKGQAGEENGRASASAGRHFSSYLALLRVGATEGTRARPKHKPARRRGLWTVRHGLVARLVQTDCDK